MSRHCQSLSQASLVSKLMILNIIKLIICIGKNGVYSKNNLGILGRLTCTPGSLVPLAMMCCVTETLYTHVSLYFPNYSCISAPTGTHRLGVL